MFTRTQLGRKLGQIVAAVRTGKSGVRLRTACTITSNAESTDCISPGSLDPALQLGLAGANDKYIADARAKQMIEETGLKGHLLDPEGDTELRKALLP